MPLDIVVAKLPDRTVIELFEKLKQDFEAVNLTYGMGEVNFSQLPESLLDKRASSYAISSANIRTKPHTLTVRFTRNHNGSPYYDLVQITPQPNSNPPPTAEEILEIETAIRTVVKLPKLNTAPFTEGGFIGIFEKELSSITSMHKDLMEEALHLKSRYEEEDIERRKKFEAEQEAARQRIEEHEKSSLSAIEASKKELDEKIGEFDLSDHMRSRRQQRKDITDEIQHALATPISSASSRMNLLMTIAFCVMAALGSGLLAFESFQSFVSASGAEPAATMLDAYLSRLIENQNPENASTTNTANALEAIQAQADSQSSGNQFLLWMLAIRGAILSAVAVGFAAYLINVLKKNYEEETRYLRELQRYGMDINRASWIIETAMEMTTKEDATLPDAWIQGACSGLFAFDGKADNEVTSLSALGALLKLGPELKAGPEGVSASFGSKAAKQAAKEAG